MRLIIICLAVAIATPTSASDVGDSITRIANKYGVNPNTVYAVAEVESGVRCGAKNGASQGIMQVQRGAAKEVGVNWPFRNCDDEIEAGVKYLKLAIDKVGDNCVAYTLYNQGLYAPRYCSDYGRKVLRKKRNG
jgi:hypothetical protein